MQQIYEASELFEAQQDKAFAGNPEWLDIIFKPKRRSDREAFGGSGLYAIFLDDLLVYIGQFVGPKDKLSAGNIRGIRWKPHLGTLTFRGKRVSIGKTTATTLSDQTGDPFAGLASSCQSESPVFLKDQGMVASPAKLAFAAENWASFAGPAEDTLKRIKFVYVKSPLTTDPAFATKEGMRRVLIAAEKALVERYAPPLNTAFNSDPREPSASLTVVLDALNNALRDAPPEPLSVGPQEDWGVADPSIDEFEPFGGRLTAAGADFIEKLEAIVEEDGALILYYTKNGTDLRIGTEREGSRNCPWLRMEWRSQAASFRVWTKLLPDDARLLGVEAEFSTDTAMYSNFEISPDQDPALLLALARATAAQENTQAR